MHWNDPEGWYGEGGGRRVQGGARIAIEFCEEDRARIDRLIERIAVLIDRLPARVNITQPDPLREELVAIVEGAKGKKPQETAEDAPEAPKSTETLTDAHPEEEKPAEAEKTAAPSVTLADIQKKVIQLCAGFGGTKKAAVREIVNAYAPKVSDLPADKWEEVMQKLTELEGA